jgi:sugar phosphate isomerase/epimerase
MAAVRGAGFSSAVVEDIYFHRLREDLDQAEELGVDFVELPLFAMDLIAGGRVLQTQMHRLHEALKARSLGYTVHGPISLNFMQPPEIASRHMTVAKAAIEVAAKIGAPHIVLHGGRMLREQTEAEIEDLYARQREAFASLGEIAAKHSMIIAVENIPPMGSKERPSLPSRLAREIEAINHPNVRGCLDFSHAALLCKAEGADFLSEAKALACVSSHLHIHDSFGDPTHFWTFSRSERLAYGLGDLHLPIGWGSIPWTAIMEDFTYQPDVIFNLELPVPYWFALEDSVRAVRDMIGVYQSRHTNRSS